MEEHAERFQYSEESNILVYKQTKKISFYTGWKLCFSTILLDY